METTTLPVPMLDQTETVVCIEGDSELTATEREDLGNLEAAVERGLGTFVEVGTALGLIRDRKLYRNDYSTFESYCQERWGLGRSQPYRYVDAAAVVKNLSPIGDIKPTIESQVRPLVALKDTEQQREAWG